MKNWRLKSLDALENTQFGEPQEAPTPMVRRCLELCRIPLNQFSVEDLRLMIGQEFSLKYLIPIAIEHLKHDLFAEGHFYPGDLLNVVLTVKPDFWYRHPEYWKEVNELIRNRREDILRNKIPLVQFDSANSAE